MIFLVQKYILLGIIGIVSGNIVISKNGNNYYIRNGGYKNKSEITFDISVSSMPYNDFDAINCSYCYK